jgi:hypothetical protein
MTAGRVKIGGAWAKSETLPIFKITRAKRTGGLSEAVESLPRKHKALSSNPSIAKKPSSK